VGDECTASVVLRGWGAYNYFGAGVIVFRLLLNDGMSRAIFRSIQAREQNAFGGGSVIDCYARGCTSKPALMPQVAALVSKPMMYVHMYFSAVLSTSALCCRRI